MQVKNHWIYILSFIIFMECLFMYFQENSLRNVCRLYFFYSFISAAYYIGHRMRHKMNIMIFLFHINVHARAFELHYEFITSCLISSSSVWFSVEFKIRICKLFTSCLVNWQESGIEDHTNHEHLGIGGTLWT